MIGADPPWRWHLSTIVLASLSPSSENIQNRFPDPQLAGGLSTRHPIGSIPTTSQADLSKSAGVISELVELMVSAILP